MLCYHDSFHGAEMELCVRHASSVASAVGASLSRGCLFATLYVSQETYSSAAAAAADTVPAVAAAVAMPEQETTCVDSSAAGANTLDANVKIGSTGRGKGILDDLVEECRELIEKGFRREQAEASAVAAAAGVGLGLDDDDDSAEEGWTSDPQELEKEAAKKSNKVSQLLRLTLCCG